MWAILLVIIFDKIEHSFIYVSKIMLINHINTSGVARVNIMLYNITVLVIRDESGSK